MGGFSETYRFDNWDSSHSFSNNDCLNMEGSRRDCSRYWKLNKDSWKLLICNEREISKKLTLNVGDYVNRKLSRYVFGSTPDDHNIVVETYVLICRYPEK